MLENAGALLFYLLFCVFPGVRLKQRVELNSFAAHWSTVPHLPCGLNDFAEV